MSTYNELQQVNEDCLSGDNPICTKQEIEEMVVFTRLELYNRVLPCGPKAIRKRLDEFYLVTPLPSERTIARILAKQCLTHGRTGCYE
jgi:putative transposase